MVSKGTTQNLTRPQMPNFSGTLVPGLPPVFQMPPLPFAQFPNPPNNIEAQNFLSQGAQVIIRMRGLPFKATPKDVVGSIFRLAPFKTI